MKEITVNVDNVVECWKLYEEYVKEFKQEHYSDVSYDGFVEWCESELFECPNCGIIQKKDDNYHLGEPLNSDDICDDCIENGGYYE